MKRALSKLLGLFVVVSAMAFSQGCSYYAAGAWGFQIRPGLLFNVKPNFIYKGRVYTNGQTLVTYGPVNSVALDFNPNAPDDRLVLSQPIVVTVDGATLKWGKTRIEVGGSRPGFEVVSPGIQQTAHVAVRYDFHDFETHVPYSSMRRQVYAEEETGRLVDRLRKRNKAAWLEIDQRARMLCLQAITQQEVPDIHEHLKGANLRQIAVIPEKYSPSVHLEIRTMIIDKLVEEDTTCRLHIPFAQKFN